MKNPTLPGPAGAATSRRSFMKGAAVAGAGTLGAGLLGGGPAVFPQEYGGELTRGDIAILLFLQAMETIEADLWRQYTELGGPSAATGTLGNSPVDAVDQNGKPIKSGISPLYIAGLQILDSDMPQYIVDNTDDEFSHESFLKSYLHSKGADSPDLRRFATLAPSQVPGVPQIGRLTNLTQLTVDTSWWTRYRSDSKNPDFGDTFDQAIPSLATGQHPAIPRTADDLVEDPAQPGGVGLRTQAIAFTAGYHFAFIEQGGSSLYPSLAQRVTNVEVLRILLSIGPTETAHFQTWQDKAGNALTISFTDPITGSTLTIPDLNDSNATAAEADEFQTNLIMPEPTFFLEKRFGRCSIVRPTETKGAAMAALQSLIDDGLFIGHTSKNAKSDGFVELLHKLAEEADEAQRGGN